MNQFSQVEMLVLIKLLIAHILGDFVLQSSTWVNSKKEKGAKSSAFYKHLIVIGTLTFLAVGQWHTLAVGVIVFIVITHGLIDLWKIKFDKDGSTSYFLADQFLHILMLIVSWVLLTQSWPKVIGVVSHVWNSFPILIVLFGYLFCIVPSSYIIKFATKQMITQDHVSNVVRGGRLIGIFERLIIFTFVLFSQYEAIGFLITGKSILRFADGQKKETEYVLVGTMMSYTLAILAGVLVNLLR